MLDKDKRGEVNYMRTYCPCFQPAFVDSFRSFNTATSFARGDSCADFNSTTNCRTSKKKQKLVPRSKGLAQEESRFRMEEHESQSVGNKERKRKSLRVTSRLPSTEVFAQDIINHYKNHRNF